MRGFMNIQKIHDQLDKIQKNPRSVKQWEVLDDLLKETTIQEVLKATSEESLTDIIKKILAIKKQSPESFYAHSGSFTDIQNEHIIDLVKSVKEDPSKLQQELRNNISRSTLDGKPSRSTPDKKPSLL